MIAVSLRPRSATALDRRHRNIGRAKAIASDHVANEWPSRDSRSNHISGDFGQIYRNDCARALTMDNDDDRITNATIRLIQRTH